MRLLHNMEQGSAVSSVAWFSVCLAFSVLSCWTLFKKSSRNTHILFTTYAGCYVATTLIGATILGFHSGVIWDVLNFGVDTTELDDYFGFIYWFLLYMPLIIAPLVLSVMERFRLPTGNQKATLIEPRLITFWTVLLIFVGFCTLKLYKAGAIGNVLAGLGWSSAYGEWVEQRLELLSSLGTVYYGFVYMSFPALGSIALFQANRKSGLGWRLAFIVTVVVTVGFSLSTLMKTPLFLFIGSLGLGLCILGRLRTSSLLVLLGLVFAALTFWQSVFYSDWTSAATAILFLFRMAHSFPFYVSLFPKVIPYLGSNFGLDILGIGPAANDNLQVFNHMYPTITFAQAAAAAPAHVRAYAQAGFAGSIATLVIIAILIHWFSRVKSIRSDPFCFALLIQGVLVCYWVSQTSLRAVLFESPSLFFGFMAIGSVWFGSLALKHAMLNIRESSNAILASVTR
jgi:hypothetical protein